MTTKPVTPVNHEKSLTTRMLAVASAIGAVEATGTNKHFHYAFLEEAVVVAEVRKHLNEHRVLFRAAIDRVESRVVGDSLHTLVYMTLSFINADNPEDRMDQPWVGEALDKGDKGLAKAITSAVKYFLIKFLLIPKQGDDPEHDATTDERGVKPAAPPKPTSPGAPHRSAQEDGQREQARQTFYSVLRTARQVPSTDNVKRLAAEALNRTITSLYQLTASDFDAMTTYVEDNILKATETGGGDEAPPHTDDDIPF